MTEKGAVASPGLIVGAGEAYRHRIWGQAATAKVAPAMVRPMATIAKETRTSRTRLILIDSGKFLLVRLAAGDPLAKSDVDDA